MPPDELPAHEERNHRFDSGASENIQIERQFLRKDEKFV